MLLMAASPTQAVTVSSNGGASTYLSAIFATDDGFSIYTLSPDQHDGRSYDTGVLADPSYSHTIDLTSQGPYATANAKTQVYVTPGTIKASVSTTANGNYYVEGYDPWGETAMAFQGADAGARVAAAYSDGVTILGPAGQSGLFQLTLSIARTYTGDSYATLTGRAMVRSVSDALLSLINVTEYATSGLINETRTVRLAAGSTVVLVSDLQLQVSTSSTWVNTGTHNASLDASNTSHVFLQALTPASLSPRKAAPCTAPSRFPERCGCSVRRWPASACRGGARREQ